MNHDQLGASVGRRPSGGLPELIQGGMGVGVSNWRLAAAVADCGQLGVVSGTALDVLLARRLQDGDADGSLRQAMESFPLPEVAAAVWKRFYRPGGRRPGEPYRALAMWSRTVSKLRQQTTVLANFVEVFLARRGRSGPVGINLLTKIQLPNLASLYGAMLAGVDYVLMGAGIPREIPRVLDDLAARRPTALRLDVEGEAAEAPDQVTLDPAALGPASSSSLKRPRFLAIVGSNSLASLITRKSQHPADGLVIEGAVAGGHNAPPRGAPLRNPRGEPVYGERDAVDLARIAELGLPFWLAGGYGSPEAVAEARRVGAAGVQVGTLFAYCRESGFAPALKQRVLAAAASGELDVLTDADASPTGFPFKVVQLEGTLAEERRYRERRRICDLGYLRAIYRKADGVGYRCPAEPLEDFVAKGGDATRTAGRKCLCNALLAAVGHAQLRPGGEAELPLLTSGDDLRHIHRFAAGRLEYTAAEVVTYLLGPP
ncbi:MAG: nitronate monooxygenase [Thermoanaerobaculia bacterium]